MQSKSSKHESGAPVKYAGFIGGVSRVVSVSDLDGDILRDTIAAVTDSGDGIMFGRTNDGGALSISVYSSGRRAVMYFTDVDSAHNALRELGVAAKSI